MGIVCKKLEGTLIEDIDTLERFKLEDGQTLVRNYGCEDDGICLYVVLREYGFGLVIPEDIKKCPNYLPE